MRAVFAMLLIFVLAPAAIAAEQDWTFLPIQDIGAREFLQDHPEYDGRGVIVAVLDTGVDMTIPGLGLTSQGLTKVIDVRDFTGQFAKDADKGILQKLKDEGKIVDQDTLVHAYPHCYRTDAEPGDGQRQQADDRDRTGEGDDRVDHALDQP